MKRVVKLAVSIAYFVGASFAELLAGRRKSALVVLYYHAVPTHLREAFARQLDTLEKCALVVPADYQGVSNVNRLVAITFDDALQSVIDVALPELVKRGMPSTIFVPSGALGRPPDWEMEIGAGDGHEIVITRETLKRIVSPLVSIGAHSVSHPHLTRLARDTAEAEIVRSKADIEGIVETPARLFAFPYGDYNALIAKLCREAGYKYAFTIIPEVIDLCSDKFLRGRVAVTLTDSQLEFWLKIRGAYTWMRFVSSLKRKLSRRNCGSVNSDMRPVRNG